MDFPLNLKKHFLNPCKMHEKTLKINCFWENFILPQTKKFHYSPVFFEGASNNYDFSVTSEYFWDLIKIFKGLSMCKKFNFPENPINTPRNFSLFAFSFATISGRSVPFKTFSKK
jgi:hypothetical protein